MYDINLKNTGVIYNPEISGAKDFALKVSDTFFAKNLTNSKASVYSVENMPSDLTFAVAIGGDGTLLRCARNYSRFDVPVFGFNMGRLGYLAQALPGELDTVTDKIKNKDFRIEKRLMLKSDTGSVALNDMVIKKELNARTSVLKLSINDKPICSYMADGLIISTPTGSTAYSLSAGGPVIAPDIDCFIITPICPHTLNARPVIVNSNEKISVEICHNAGYQIIADGQDVRLFQKNVTVEKYEKCAELLLLNKERSDFYRVLTEKLHWGTAPSKC